MDIRLIYRRTIAVLHSSRGHNLLVFTAFLAVSAILWFVMALNDEEQCDVRMSFNLTNVPDTVTIIARPPENIAVSLRARGSQRLRLALINPPKLVVDFRLYRSRSALRLSNTELKAIARGALDGADVILVSPDSVILPFTTSSGTPLPVRVDYSVTAGPSSSLVGKPSTSVDSVRVFSLHHLPASVRSVSTAPIRLTDLKTSTTTRAALIAPPGTRVVPDSIDVTFNVQPLILKTRSVTIEPVHVPAGVRLITFPSRIDVMYMIPLSEYKDSEPRMRVVADYSTIDFSNPTHNIRLRLKEVSPNLQNVHLVADSAEFIIEHL